MPQSVLPSRTSMSQSSTESLDTLSWRLAHLVCAIQAAKKGVCLRFLYGVLQDDPRGVLRAGTSVLKTWDLGFEDVVDPAAVGAYVTQAVGRYSGYKANAQEVLDASRAAATARRPPMGGS
jgi:hypothetical protein